MAVTPDNSALIGADSYRHNVVAFDTDSSGGLSNRYIWADLGKATRRPHRVGVRASLSV